MREKIQSWWSEDGKWFCILTDDGVNKTTISLTPDEAKSLAREADPEIQEKLRVVRRQRDDMTSAFNASLCSRERIS